MQQRDSRGARARALVRAAQPEPTPQADELERGELAVVHQVIAVLEEARAERQAQQQRSAA